MKIWDSVTGKELFALKGQAGRVNERGVQPGWPAPGFRERRRFYRSLGDEASLPKSSTSGNQANGGRSLRRLLLRADVLERLRTLPGMSPSRRQEAITVAQTYPEDPVALNDLAWPLVKLPGGEMSGYRKALRYSEEACQLEPKNGLSLNTLGMAYYRVGNYEKALATLLRSDQINKAPDTGGLNSC